MTDTTTQATLLYRVIFHRPGRKALPLATVKAVEDATPARAYHLWQGKHMRPDYGAIKDALGHRYAKAYGRAGSWWFPAGHQPEVADDVGANGHLHASLHLHGARGQLLGRLEATPYVYR